METVAANVERLTSYNRSMAVALEKAERGGNAEDIYFLEKLEKSAVLLGYKLERVSRQQTAPTVSANLVNHPKINSILQPPETA